MVKDKLSVPEIAERLRVSLDAAYYFMRHNNLPRRTLSENDAIRFANKQSSFHVRNVLTQTQKELKILGLALYWGEGSKLRHTVDFTNSDPKMVRIFLHFLREICRVDELRLRVQLYCHTNQNVGELFSFWSTVTKIPRAQFTKPYVRHDFEPNKIGKMPHGLIHIRYCDKKLLHTILSWIEECAHDYS